MCLSSKTKQYLAAAWTIMLAATNAQLAGAENNFVNQYKNFPGYPDADHRFVVLNSGIANIAAQRFALPKDTISYPLAGMTLFPYYQASAPLKEFLNNATAGGMPVNQIPTTPQLPQFTLPPTDYIHISVPLPAPRLDKRQTMQMSVRDRRMKDDIPWMVANQGGQAFALPGDPEALVLVSSGTMFGASASRTMLLRCGTMWILTAEKPAAVLTRHGAVCVRPFSIAAVEQTWFNKVRVAGLYGQTLDFQLTAKGNTKKIAIEKGKELTISEAALASSAVPEAATAPKAGISTTAAATPALLQSPDFSLNKKDIDPESASYLLELQGISPPIASLKMSSDYQRMFSSFGISPAMRRAEMQRQNLQRYNLANRSALQKTATGPGVYPVPDVTEPVPLKFPHVAEELKTMNMRQAVIKYLSNADLQQESNGRPVLNAGEAVFVAADSTQLRVNDCYVYARRGALVHVLSRNGVAVVRNIGESEPGCVKVRIKSRSYELELGSELIVGNSAPSIFDEMKTDGVGRRNVHSIEATTAGIFINKSEVDLATLMQYSPIMRKLYKSRNERDQNLVEQLMKNTVSLNMVTQGRGYYRRMSGLPGPH